MAIKTVPLLVAALARIRTRFGLLCCEPPVGSNPNVWAAQHAWVGVTNLTGGQLHWAQTGYMKYREPGWWWPTIRLARYWEVQGGTFGAPGTGQYQRTFGPAPAQNTTHTYACELLAPSPTALATWDFRYDGVSWGQYTDPWWSGFAFLGNRLDFTGEIHNFEDDMPGTVPPAPAALTCLFTNCQFRDLNVTTLQVNPWAPAALVPPDVVTDNAAEWGARWISPTSFEIWDVKPN